MDHVESAIHQVQQMPEKSFQNLVTDKDKGEPWDALNKLKKLTSSLKGLHLNDDEFEIARASFEELWIYLSESPVPKDRALAIKPYRVDMHIGPDSTGHIIAAVRARDNHDRPEFFEEGSSDKKGHVTK